MRLFRLLCSGAACAHRDDDNDNRAAPDRWGVAMALYMIGFISYGATLVFYAAVFPRLARNTKHARDLRERHEKGEVSAEEYEVEESMEKNRISNISTVSFLEAFTEIGRSSMGAERAGLDAQQCRLHLYSCSEPLPFASTQDEPKSQQLCYRLVSAKGVPSRVRPCNATLWLGRMGIGSSRVSGGVGFLEMSFLPVC